jgi:hypothetical protein
MLLKRPRTGRVELEDDRYPAAWAVIFKLQSDIWHIKYLVFHNRLSTALCICGK